MKRGLSTIVATLLIILLTLVAVGIIWVVVRNIIENNSEQISLGKFTLNLKISGVEIINSTNIDVTVKRNAGVGEIAGINFIVYDEHNSEIVKYNVSMEELEERNFKITLRVINTSLIKKISIAPIFKLKSGKEMIGDILDEYIINSSDLVISNCVSNCAGKNCGNDGCSGSCGNCAEEQICSQNGICESKKQNISITGNKKNMNLFSDREVFLISDKNWKDVLLLIPLTTWTGNESCNKGHETPNGICVYPTLIYHEETGDLFVDLASGATATASSSYVTTPPSRAIDGDDQTDWNSGSNEEGYLKLDLKEIKQFNRIDVFEAAEPYYISIYISQDDLSYQKIVDNYTLKYGIGFASVRNVFTFNTVSARYVKFVLTDNPKQLKYPNWKTIVEIKIYGEEKNPYSSFDADSIIHFMQQYAAEKVIIVGESPLELDNLLIAQPELGAGLNQNQVQRISVDDYLSYWEDYKNVVYVEDNYEQALLASTYASLLDVPLIIKGTALDVDGNFVGRNIICVGQISGRTCNESYNLESLQEKYILKTNTDKIILVNPNDLNIKLEEEFQPDKSSGKIYELYSKTSLASPILASAKHEIIISTTATDYISIGNFIKDKINHLMPNIINNTNGIKRTIFYPGGQYDYYIYGFLTIFSAPYTIPSQDFLFIISSNEFYRALDQSEYGDIYLKDGQPDLSVGRIQGITLSDVSSYLARDLFYDRFTKTNNIQFMAKSFVSMINYADSWTKMFNEAGYNADCSIVNDISYVPGTDFVCSIDENSSWPNLWKSKDLIMFLDHGGPYKAGIISSDIPYLSNSVIYVDACLTCSSQDGKSFCNDAIRKGSLGFIGTVSSAFEGDPTYTRTLNGIYKDGLSLGQSFSRAYTRINQFMVTLIGDPTLNLNPDYLLKGELQW